MAKKLHSTGSKNTSPAGPSASMRIEAPADGAQRLSEDRVRAFAALLRKKRAGLLPLLSVPVEHVHGGDEADEAAETAAETVEVEIEEVSAAVLARIDDALQRVREGTFGVCVGCSSDIPLNRLEALPYAEYCITCQRAEEREGDDISVE